MAPRAWPGVHVSDPLVSQALRLALAEAVQWFAVPECQDLLKDYRDRTGIPLAERLPVDPDGSDYLALLLFRDAPDARYCAGGSLAFTSPGSRVVFICAQAMLITWTTNARHAVAGIVHEALHTLGLGENPPASSEITARILATCGCPIRKR